MAKEKDTTGFGQRLKLLREAKNLSQEALGDLCKPRMRGQAIARLESSDRTPSWETVLRLADAMGVSTEEFREQGESAAEPATDEDVPKPPTKKPRGKGGKK